MASNAFGTIFKITTWGESHGKAIGAVIDGCPAGLLISEDDINLELKRRAPGKNAYTSPRKEPDQAQILSGVFEGHTTGAPICILIPNKDQDSSKYEPIKHLLRPGHANFTYLQKYGVFDHRGGGRASARETACRVAAGAIAKKLLAHFNVRIQAYVQQVGTILAKTTFSSLDELQAATESSPLFCPDHVAAEKMMQEIERVKEAGDSVGGVIEFVVNGLPVGLGDPVFEKLDANLAKAMLSIHATKGFELGSGFASASMQGSEHNDLFTHNSGRIGTLTNHAGGVLGGISTGMPIIGKVAFKPASSIMQPMKTVDLEGNEALFSLPEGSRHDPCVAIRAVPIVEAMAALVLADAFLLNRSAQL